MFRSSILLCLAFCLAQTAFAQSLQVFVSSRSGNSVVLFDENGIYISDFIPSGYGGLSYPQEILFHPDGSMLVTGFGNTEIKKYDGITGAYLGAFSSGYTLDLPSKMSIGPDSLIYVTQWGQIQNKVVRFDLQGNFVDEFTSIGAPKGLGHLWDADKNFYIAQFGLTGWQGEIHKFDSLGNDLGTFINTTILDGPTSIWWDDNGDMLIEDWDQGKVLRYDSTGQYVGVFATGMTNPEGLAFLPNGDILMGDWGEDAVHRLDSNGNLLGYFCSSNVTDPNGVTVRPAPTAGIITPQKGVMSVWPTIGEVFTIAFSNGIALHSDITIHNAQGQLVKRIAPEERVIWNASDLPEGIYLIHVTNRIDRYTGKVTVKR